MSMNNKNQTHQQKNHFTLKSYKSNYSNKNHWNCRTVGLALILLMVFTQPFIYAAEGESTDNSQTQQAVESINLEETMADTAVPNGGAADNLSKISADFTNSSGVSGSSNTAVSPVTQNTAKISSPFPVDV